MKRYRLYLNEVYQGTEQVDFDGVVRFIEADDVFAAMETSFKVAKECGCHAYRLMEGGAAEYKLTAAYSSWWV